MMRYKLVIAEKPSVAQRLAAVIGATVRKDGYLEGNGWRVSWCVGHLAGLADADVYNPDYAKWRYDDLPILPEHWQMVVGKDKKKQFDVLKKLMNAPDVTEVVNACDAGREGELIFRSVYELAGCQKPMKRLWISSMEDSAIREGFANLRPGADYDGLRDAALCRAKADWLVGINATRLFSVLYHRTLNIGRVMSPTLALIVQREAEIDTFQSIPFYTVALELPGLTVSGERMSDRASAEQLKEACQGAAVTIKKVECKEKSEKPPALYDLTTLQRDANRLLGFTAQQTLDYLQSLYEKKLCTYPRTDSRYLTGDMADSLPVLVNLVANAMPFRKGIAITCIITPTPPLRLSILRMPNGLAMSNARNRTKAATTFHIHLSLSGTASNGIHTPTISSTTTREGSSPQQASSLSAAQIPAKVNTITNAAVIHKTTEKGSRR